MSRYFVHVDQKTNKKTRRYHGHTPKQAATKCASKIFQKIKSNGGNINQKINLIIREVTRNSTKKYYAYEARRITNHYQTIVHIGDKIIHYNYTIKLNKLKIPDRFNVKPKKIDIPIIEPINVLSPKMIDIGKHTLIIEV
jgi:hypothetical protein